MKNVANLTVIFLAIFTLTSQFALGDLQIKTRYIQVDGKQVELKDGLDLSGKVLKGTKIHLEGGTLKNVNFDGCTLDGVDFSESTMVACSFRNAEIKNRSFLYIDPSCDMTDAHIHGKNSCEHGAYVSGMSVEQLKSTYSYKHKNLRHLTLLDSDFAGMDFSSYTFKGVYAGGKFSECDFTDAILDEYTLIPMTFEQLKSTRSYKEGKLIKTTLSIRSSGESVDFSRMNLSGSAISLRRNTAIQTTGEVDPDEAKIDLTDSVITNARIDQLSGLTLENVKSTWNYKTDNMAGIILPAEIQAALDAEAENEGGK